MIKAECLKGEDFTNVSLTGTTGDLMNEFRGICGGMRKLLSDNLGEKDGEKILYILASGKPEDEIKKAVEEVLEDHAVKKISKLKKKASEGNIEAINSLLEEVFGRKE